MGDFDYPYGYTYEWEEVFESMGAGVLGVFALIYALVMLLSFAVSVGSYILNSFGLYTIAQRRGIRNSWLAWIPMGNLWILGSISDQFQYLTKGKVKNRRKVLLSLSIGLLLVCFTWLIGMIASFVADNGLAAALGTLGGFLVLVIVAIVLTVLQYMAYYDLFCSCQPENGVLYLILSILVSVMLPVLVFVCRKKDGGMPPKKRPAPQVIPEPVTATEPKADAAPAVTAEPEEGFAKPEEFEET